MGILSTTLNSGENPAYLQIDPVAHEQNMVPSASDVHGLCSGRHRPPGTDKALVSLSAACGSSMLPLSDSLLPAEGGLELWSNLMECNHNYYFNRAIIQ